MPKLSDVPAKTPSTKEGIKDINLDDLDKQIARAPEGSKSLQKLLAIRDLATSSGTSTPPTTDAWSQAENDMRAYLAKDGSTTFLPSTSASQVPITLSPMNGLSANADRDIALNAERSSLFRLG